MDYFVLMDIRTKSKYRELLLKTYIIYGDCSNSKKVLNQLCGEESSCRDDVLSKKDHFGLSIADVNLKCGL
jgi:hypothetical protein